MEELCKFFKIWLTVIISLCYCYYVSYTIPKGMARLLSLLPVIFLFIVLPFHHSPVVLLAPTVFFLTWLAVFKLLLFACNKPPLFACPPRNLVIFVTLASLPIKLHENPKSDPKSTSLLEFFVKLSLFSLLFPFYKYRDSIHHHGILILYCLHVYLQLEIFLDLASAPARSLLRLQLEPQFNKPYLSTSLQDFWGRRWNLMVTDILRRTVYDPVKSLAAKTLLGPKLASAPAMLLSFLVSGFMHELVYFCFTRVAPTWEVTSFFALHGVCVVLEVMAKKMVAGRWQLNPFVSGSLTLFFLIVTADWLFFPQLTRNGVDLKAIEEIFIFFDFAQNKFKSILFSK